MKQVLEIEGMSCKHCAARIEEGVASLPGVKKMKVNLRKQEGKVTLDETELSIQQVLDKIEELGYQAEVK